MLQVSNPQGMEEVQKGENAKEAETPGAVGAPVQNEVASSSSQPPQATTDDTGVPKGGWKRPEPESLRRFSEAMEGWKNKQQEIHKKFMESFDSLGKDISKMQHDTVNFKSEIDIVKGGLQRRESSPSKSLQARNSILARSSKSDSNESSK